jgi:hypothetical protein
MIETQTGFFFMSVGLRTAIRPDLGPLVVTEIHMLHGTQVQVFAYSCRLCSLQCAQQACWQASARSAKLIRQSRCMPHVCLAPVAGYKPLAGENKFTVTPTLRHNFRLCRLSSHWLIS